jgi:serine/threonine protein kinase
MELAENGDLSGYLNRDWGVRWQAIVICGIVLGMRYAHRRGIMHRDLKPANIYLDEHWHALIGDFGLSRSGLAEGPPTPQANTRLCAAPEQLEIGVQHTDKVDVFAFG